MPVTTVALGGDTSLAQSVFRAAEVACDGGAISAAERDAWVSELQQRIATQRYFAAITYFIVRGEKA